MKMLGGTGLLCSGKGSWSFWTHSQGSAASQVWEGIQDLDREALKAQALRVLEKEGGGRQLGARWGPT